MKLNTLTVTLAAVAFAFNGFAGETTVATDAQPSSINVDVSTTASSERVFRGTSTGSIAGEAVVESTFALPADINARFETAHTQSSSTVADPETDVSAEFTKSFGDYLIGLNYTWYSQDFAKKTGTAQEVGLSINRLFGPVNVTYTQYLATQGDNNGYSQLSGLYSNDFGKLPVVLDFYLEAGYFTQQNKVSHILAKVSTDLPVIGDIVAAPFLAYSLGLNKADSTQMDVKNLFFGGIEFKHKF